MTLTETRRHFRRHNQDALNRDDGSPDAEYDPVRTGAILESTEREQHCCRGGDGRRQAADHGQDAPPQVCGFSPWRQQTATNDQSEPHQNAYSEMP
jgi:hypothetical protein